MIGSYGPAGPPSYSTAEAKLADSGGSGELVAPLTVPSDTVLLGVEGWGSEPPKVMTAKTLAADKILGISLLETEILLVELGCEIIGLFPF